MSYLILATMALSSGSFPSASRAGQAWSNRLVPPPISSGRFVRVKPKGCPRACTMEVLLLGTAVVDGWPCVHCKSLLWARRKRWLRRSGMSIQSYVCSWLPGFRWTNLCRFGRHLWAGKKPHPAIHEIWVGQFESDRVST